MRYRYDPLHCASLCYCEFVFVSLAFIGICAGQQVFNRNNLVTLSFTGDFSSEVCPTMNKQGVPEKWMGFRLK